MHSCMCAPQFTFVILGGVTWYRGVALIKLKLIIFQFYLIPNGFNKKYPNNTLSNEEEKHKEQCIQLTN